MLELICNNLLDVQTLLSPLRIKFTGAWYHVMNCARLVLGKSKNDWRDVNYVLMYFAQRRIETRKRDLDLVRQG